MASCVDPLEDIRDSRRFPLASACCGDPATVQGGGDLPKGLRTGGLSLGNDGEIFRANRHVGKLHENARNRQKNRAIQQTLVGRFVTFGTTRDHSERPSISIAN